MLIGAIDVVSGGQHMYFRYLSRFELRMGDTLSETIVFR
jgi:hypothetical protein